MQNKICLSCKNEIAGDSVFCEHCGQPQETTPGTNLNPNENNSGHTNIKNDDSRPESSESKLIVYGYTQQVLGSPKIRVFVDGAEVGEVARGETLEIPLTKTSEIIFKYVYKLKITALYGKVTQIQLGWDRWTGAPTAKIIN